MAGTLRLALATALLLAVLAEAATAAPNPPLSQSGRWITDASGRVVILHGVNMVYKRPPYHPAAAGFGAADARFLRTEGFNTVRLGVIYAGVEPQPGRYDERYLDRIGDSVRALAQERIFAMLDFHQDMYNERFQGEGFPDWAVQDDGLPAFPQLGFPGNLLFQPATNRAYDHFWANSPGPGGVGLQDRYAAAWRHVAARFRNAPYNMGYDLFNEPWPGTGWQLCASNVGCPAFDMNKLTPMSQRAYDRIREVDGKRIVWYEPNVIYNNGSETHHGDLGPRSGMSFHIYCLQEGNTPRPSPLDPLQAASCELFERLPFENAIKQSDETGDTMLLTEFGATDDLDQIERVEESADRFMTGWQYWHYCSCDDPTTSGSGGTQAVVNDAAKPPTGSNVRTAKLERLARAYPQAVAGTPRSFDFDRSTSRFHLDYSTQRVGGGPFAFGADTEVFIPRRHYPRGYDVVASGAEPLSKPGASVLVLRNCSGRSRVGVIVKPGTGRAKADCKAPRRPRIKLRVRPRRVHPAVLTRFRFKATLRGRPVRRARIRLAGHRVRTNRRGRAKLRVRLRRAGHRYRVRVKKGGYRGRAIVRVRRR
jgi:endoglycosylceramidase